MYLVVPVTAARLANRRRGLVSSGNWPLYEECWKVIKHILATTGNQSEVVVVVTNIHAVPRESSSVAGGGGTTGSICLWDEVRKSEWGGERVVGLLG